MARGSGNNRPEIWLRQFPGKNPVWGACRFDFDVATNDYDWLVVYDDLPPLAGERFSRWTEVLPCPRRHTLLVTGEPSSVKVYGSDFLNQFGVILTSQEPEFTDHPDAVRRQAGLRWYYGIGPHSTRTFDDMVAHPPDDKKLVISTVCSSKQQRHTLHHARYGFVQSVRPRLPELDIFGHGVRFMEDKAEALDAYRYHIAIENHVAANHWTEKLADSFLGLTLPFYHGCPNTDDYFPADCVIPVNIHDPVGAVKIIRNAIASGQYEKRLPLLREARRRVLEEYNLFAELSRIIESRHRPDTDPAPGRILGRHLLRKKRPLILLRYAWETWRARYLARKNRPAPPA